MDKLFEKLMETGGLIKFAVFVLPGFIAWRTLQMRRPQGDQKALDAVVDIAVGSVATSLLWFIRTWTAWPTTFVEATELFLEVFFTPIVLAVIYVSVLDFAANKSWVVSSHPRAWDYLFNSLAHRRKGIGSDGLLLIATLKNGDRVAGVYSEPGFASLWPYDRDLLLGQTWQLEGGRPARRVAGSIGIYLDKDNIDAIEILDYFEVVQSALEVERALVSAASQKDLKGIAHGSRSEDTK